MKYFEVNEIFGDIRCPHCGETALPKDEDIDTNIELHYFNSTKQDSKPECLQFNNLLNEKLFALRDGHASRQEVEAWASQYKH